MLLCTTKITSPDSLFSSLQIYSGIFTSLSSNLLTLFSIPDYWRPGTPAPTKKSGNFDVSFKPFCSIALTSSSRKLTELSGLKLPRPFVNPSDDPFQFKHIANKSVLVVTASLIHYICNSLDAPMKAARYTLLDHSPAFDSNSRSFLLHKLKTCGCSEPFWFG